MDGSTQGPEGARERLAAWQGRIDRMAADTRAMSERMQEVRVTASDPHGIVELTVDSTGSLVGLELTDRIQRVSPATVSQAIMATLGQARGTLAERSREVVAETMGTDSAAGRAIADSLGRLFGADSEITETSETSETTRRDDPDVEYDVDAQFRRR